MLFEMKECLICFLCLFVSFNDGHTLARIELNNITDVYELKEGQSTLTITHPQDDKSILRDIVYFHVIEKPYDKQKEITETHELNTRYFTNGHGNQYVDGNNGVTAEREDNDDDEIPVEEQDDTDQYEYDDEYETEVKTESAPDGYEENDHTTADSNTEENVDGDIKKDANDKEIGTIDTEIPEVSVKNKELESLDVGFGDTASDNEPTQVQSESRRKREINYRNLPDAPQLPEFKLDILPDYIKAIIFADQKEDINEKDNIKDEIEKQVKELVNAVNHPPSIEKANKMNARTIGNSLDIDSGDKHEGSYGMSLAGSSGKVWNNINTHHLHYVSEPETVTITIPIQNTRVSTATAIATDAPWEESFEDIRVNNDFNKPKNVNNLKDIEDSLDEVNKLEELIQNSENETLAPTTATYDIEDSYTAKQSMEDNVSKKREVRNGDSQKDDKKGNQKREVRTYGMSLAGDSGVVWNDVNTHISYHVGEPDSNKSTTSVPEDVTASTAAPTTVTIDEHNDSEESKEVNDLDEWKDIEESLDQINKMLEELTDSIKETKPTDKSTNTSGDNNGDSSEKKGDKNSDELKNIEDSFDEINKLLEELIKNSTNDATTESNRYTKEPDNVNEITSTSTTEEPVSTQSTPTDVTMESTTIDKTTDVSTTTLKPDIKYPDDKYTERKDKNETTKHNEDSKQKQFVKELMKNKFFWQWLQDSSAAYLEVMLKKLDDLIKAEVGKQIKQYIEEHKNVTNCKPENNGKNNTLEKPIENDNATDIDTIVTTEKTVETNSTDVNQNTTSKPVENKEPNELNNNIDKTKNNNSTEDDLARRQNKDTNNKKDTPIKIEAENVYGYSAGNGKVTNIFIFNISKESQLGNIKPLTNGTNGVFVFGLDDKTDKGKVNKQNEDDKNEEKDVTAKPETKDEHKEDKLDIDQVTTAKPETTAPATEEPKDNSIDTTTENTAIDNQTTTVSKTTTTTRVDEVSTTEKVIETTTEAKESVTEDSKDKNDEPNKSTDSTTQNTDDKQTDTSQLNESNDKSQNPNKEADKDITSTERNKASVDVTTNGNIDTTEIAEAKDNEIS